MNIEEVFEQWSDIESESDESDSSSESDEEDIGNESDEQSWREETGRFLCISLVCFTSTNITKSIIMINTFITNYMLTTHYAHPGELPAPNVPPFTASPGVSLSLLKDLKPLHYFQLFLSTQLITVNPRLSGLQNLLRA